MLMRLSRLYPEIWVVVFLTLAMVWLVAVPSTSYSANDTHRLRPVGFTQQISRPIASGVTHYQLQKTSGRGPLLVNVIEVDLNQPGVSIQPVLASAKNVHGKSSVRNLANAKGAVAAINASFFKPDTGTAIGMVILNQELMAGPLYNRVCLGITSTHQVRMDRLTFAGKLALPNGTTLPISNVNQPRLGKKEWIVYTHRWGAKSPNTPIEGVQLQVRQGEVMAISQAPLAIPKDGYVLVGPAADLVSHPIRLAEQVAMQIYTKPDWSDVPYAISGGPYLMRQGQLYVDSSAQHFLSKAFLGPAPRTAVGVTADNRLLMVTVDGRQKSVSVGVTLYEMAKLMQSLGAVDAMNFDGGSSTQMVVKGKLVNSPTVAGGAAVSNALMVFADSTGIDKTVIGSNTTLGWGQKTSLK